MIRAELRRIYELSGAQKELAMMLKEDADQVEDEAERAELLKKVGMALLSIDEIEEAAPALKASLEILPGDPEATAALADVYLADGNVGEATAMLDEAIAKCKGKRVPQLGVLLHRRAQVARAQEDNAGELSWLKQAVLADRASGWIAVELADRSEECEDWDMAIWALRTIAMIKGDTPLPRAEVFLRQGKIALVRGDDKRAKLFARQAQQEDEESEAVKAFLQQLGIG
jgi:tetratricopeptide (TPR) repeat protein